MLEDTMSNSEILEKYLGKKTIYLYWHNQYIGLLSYKIDKRYVRYTDTTIEIAQFVDGSISEGYVGIQTTICINYDKLEIEGEQHE